MSVRSVILCAAHLPALVIREWLEEFPLLADPLRRHILVASLTKRTKPSRPLLTALFLHPLRLAMSHQRKLQLRLPTEASATALFPPQPPKPRDLLISGVLVMARLMCRSLPRLTLNFLKLNGNSMRPLWRRSGSLRWKIILSARHIPLALGLSLMMCRQSQQYLKRNSGLLICRTSILALMKGHTRSQAKKLLIVLTRCLRKTVFARLGRQGGLEMPNHL